MPQQTTSVQQPSEMVAAPAKAHARSPGELTPEKSSNMESFNASPQNDAPQHSLCFEELREAILAASAGDLPKARIHKRQAERLMTALPADQQPRAKLEYAVVCALILKGSDQYLEALDCLFDAETLLEIFPEGRAEWAASIETEIAHCLVITGNAEEAIQRQLSVLSQLESQQNLQGLIQAHATLALAYQHLGNASSYVRQLETLVEIHQNSDPRDNDAIVFCCVEASKVQGSMGNWQRAFQLAEFAHDFCKLNEVSDGRQQDAEKLWASFQPRPQSPGHRVPAHRQNPQLAQEIALARAELMGLQAELEAAEAAYRAMRDYSARTAGRLGATTGHVLVPSPPDPQLQLQVRLAQQRLETLLRLAEER